ncbi:MAG: cysteine desulfurase family protein [Acetobacteraceae bacterium]
MTYLDANAAERLRPAARAALISALEEVGNPSSVHAPGRIARRILENAREELARRFGADPADLVFVSGGTEADALALYALGAGRRVIVGATEHDAVRAAAPQAITLAVDRNGVADLGDLARLLAEGPPALVVLMLANNETGVLQPVAEAARLCRRFGAFLHVDAVAAAGRIAIDLAALGASTLAISSHKLGGPAGAGALFLAPEAAALFRPLIGGGGQERGRRGGTPPVAVIAGFAAAAREATAAPEALRDEAEEAAIAAGAIVLGAGAPRLSNTTSLALSGVRAETQVIAMDLAGVAVSAGAACSSGKVSRSHVLEAMGAGPLAGQAIRVSLPWNATRADIVHFASAYAEMAGRLLRPAA